VVDFKIVGPVFLTQYTLLHLGSTLPKKWSWSFWSWGMIQCLAGNFSWNWQGHITIRFKGC